MKNRRQVIQLSFSDPDYKLKLCSPNSFNIMDFITVCSSIIRFSQCCYLDVLFGEGGRGRGVNLLLYNMHTSITIRDHLLNFCCVLLLFLFNTHLRGIIYVISVSKILTGVKKLIMKRTDEYKRPCVKLLLRVLTVCGSAIKFFLLITDLF